MRKVYLILASMLLASSVQATTISLQLDEQGQAALESVLDAARRSGNWQDAQRATGFYSILQQLRQQAIQTDEQNRRDMQKEIDRLNDLVKELKKE